jgi:ATP-binding cassette subfamily C protein
LLEIETECFRELVINGEPQIATWITTWLEQWENVFADLTPPAIDFLSEGKGNFALLENQTFGLSSGKTSWIKIQQGTVHLMGFPELKLTSTDFFPLSDKMWLTADESVQLSTQPITSVNNLDALISGLSQLQIKLLCYIDELKQQETTDELSRLQAQENFNHQVITEALRELTSVLGEKNSVFFGEGTSLLLVAVGAVGKAMGVTIRPPVEDLKQIKDPLAAIARASRLKIRRVLLRDNWWKKDGGPILAYTIEDNRPVALLPISATCYEIFEGSKHTRRRVNSHIAQTLAPFGYIFYRSLPDKALSILELIHFATQGRGADLWMILFTAELTH